MKNLGILFLAIIFSTFALAQEKDMKKSNKMSNEKNIVQTAIDAASFKTLVKAVTEADLVNTLEGKGPFTVFAPTDEAFSKLPKGTLESLLQDKEALKKILLYHVVSGDVTSKDVVKLTDAKTVEGSDVKIKVKDGKVMINNAKVIKADVKASNGVIHVIDTVLLPPQK